VAAETTAEAEVVITHPTGLHARPAVKLTKLAKGFAADVRLRVAGTGGPWVDAKSIARVMGLKAGAGRTLWVRAEGADARAAVDALVALVGRNFDEPGPAS
jgi:phosphocarrier protein HPr